MNETLLWAPRAWMNQRWCEAVLLRIGADGRFLELTPDIAAPPAGATRLAGPALPGLVDGHSHAFQRAFAGMAERSALAREDFWSWRERMYQVALRITPAQQHAIAAQLYMELLLGGYTQICEFNYLQLDAAGQPYQDPLQLSWALVEAGEEAGIGMTLVPVLYEHAGFDHRPLQHDQRRFASTPESVWAAAQRIASAGRPLLQAGIAVHSLRAASAESIHKLHRLAQGFSGPVHIHASEQRGEVEQCLAATGLRPIEWLVREQLLDRRWQLVHATHAEPAEIAGVARSGAGVVVCPSTEGNLGDGRFELGAWLDAGVPIAIGTDSHITRAWREELRWLDYSQRIAQFQRGASAAPAAGWPSAAERLYSGALAAGGRAAGEASWGFVPGARADLLVVDTRDHALLGIPAAQLLDALVFSSPGRPWRSVMVAGRWVVQEHVHPRAAGITQRFEQAMQELWA